MDKKFTSPTAEESRRFLMSFLFGGSMNPGLRECVRRAYLDFSRTAHGVGKFPDSNILKLTGHELLERLLKEAIERKEPWDADSYDKWHEAQCALICQHYAEGKFDSFCIGQAQKWINMSVKYALTLHATGILPVMHAAALRKVAHVPLDDFIVKSLLPFGPPNLGSSWSRIRTYNSYYSYQQWFREHFKNNIPLDVEFHLWIEEAKKRRKPASGAPSKCELLPEQTNDEFA